MRSGPDFPDLSRQNPQPRPDQPCAVRGVCGSIEEICEL